MAVSLALGAIGCGSKKSNTSGANTPTSSAATPAATIMTPLETAGQTPAGSAVSVNITEYIVAPAPTSASAGHITFTVKNIGGTEHELQVIKTELAPGALPANADHSANLQGAGVQVAGSVPKFAKQEKRSLTLDLQPGSYVLICNVVQQNSNGTTTSHYAEGMRAAFTVQ